MNARLPPSPIRYSNLPSTSQLLPFPFPVLARAVYFHVDDKSRKAIDPPQKPLHAMPLPRVAFPNLGTRADATKIRNEVPRGGGLGTLAGSEGVKIS